MIRNGKNERATKKDTHTENKGKKETSNPSLQHRRRRRGVPPPHTHTDTHTDKHTQTHRHTQTHTQTHTETNRHRNTQT